MGIKIVYILKSSTGPYSLETADSAQEFIAELQHSRRIGYEVFRSFQVSEEGGNNVFGICAKFVSGTLSLEELTKQMASLLVPPASN